MVDSNKIGSLTRTWPTQPIKKDHPDNKNNQTKSNKKEKSKPNNDEEKDPGDTIIDEYV